MMSGGGKTKKLEKVMSFKNHCWPKMEQKDCVAIGKFPAFPTKHKEDGPGCRGGSEEGDAGQSQTFGD